MVSKTARQPAHATARPPSSGAHLESKYEITPPVGVLTASPACKSRGNCVPAGGWSRSWMNEWRSLSERWRADSAPGTAWREIECTVGTVCRVRSAPRERGRAGLELLPTASCRPPRLRIAPAPGQFPDDLAIFFAN